MTVEFVEGLPPTNNRGMGRRWLAVAEKLRDRPGEWAVIRRGAPDNTMVTRAKKGEIRAFVPVEHYELTSITTDGRIDIYARYTGEGD